MSRKLSDYPAPKLAFSTTRRTEFPEIAGLGKVVRQMRGELPIKELSFRIGCDPSFIYRLEKLKIRKVSLEFIWAFCKAVDAQPQSFIDKLYQYDQAKEH